MATAVDRVPDRKIVIFVMLLVVFSSLTTAVIISPTLGEHIWGTLGFGFIPVGIWSGSMIALYRYRREWMVKHHRLWIAGILLVLANIGILSFFNASQGILAETGLSGNWGQALGGDPLIVGFIKVGILLALIPFVISLRRSLVRSKRIVLILGHLTILMIHLMAAFVSRVGSGAWHFISNLRSRPQVITVLDEESGPEFVPTFVPNKTKSAPRVPAEPANQNKESLSEADSKPEQPRINRASKWRLPSVDLLSTGEANLVSRDVLDEMARRIETTLAEHGVEVFVKDIRTGPRVIRFGLVPGWVKKNRENRAGRSSEEAGTQDLTRVKVHNILARERDLALALKTTDLRIESPIPGEGLVGLEVPNPNPSLVLLRSVAMTPEFRKIAGRGGLPLALGQGTGGDPVTMDLIDLPHLLIAGATGSGKSVSINSLITSMLMASRPDRLRMIMIDPKRVELTPFNGIPHLLIPVVVNSDEVLKVLHGLIREMFRRYRLLEEAGVRNIDRFNEKSKDPMSFIVLIIDELADLMMSAGYEVEQALVRLAQLGRATGIHLILCTQRPSVNVVTGLLKANIAARVAFAVSSQVDSRVILDGAGAEKLLGKGDMLFLSAQSPKPRRIQGTLVSDPEIEELIEFWSSQKGPPLPGIFFDEPEEAEEEYGNDNDELLNQVRDMAQRYHHISPSLLQRRLQIGYPKAMQLINILEDEGLLSSGEPGRTRAVVKESGGWRPGDEYENFE
ncbi:hypothetical protein FIM04_04655 [SAR202 cluster bacterium AC-409-J13_OGT_754m]|nr:hypothetical protein [SAR202 cluster bacterium AC-409-J13_OGT_754m]